MGPEPELHPGEQASLLSKGHRTFVNPPARPPLLVGTAVLLLVALVGIGREVHRGRLQATWQSEGIVGLTGDICQEPWKAGPTAAEQATPHLCQFVCPCCHAEASRFTFRCEDAEDDSPTTRVATAEPPTTQPPTTTTTGAMHASPHNPGGWAASSFPLPTASSSFPMPLAPLATLPPFQAPAPAISSPHSLPAGAALRADGARRLGAPSSIQSGLLRRWELEDFQQLYTISDSTFHKKLLTSVVNKRNLKEFLSRHASTAEFADLMGTQMAKNWTDEELAIHMYTTNLLYFKLNKILREASSLDDVDEYWQSYIYYLKKGLEEYAEYGAVETWRGVRDVNATSKFKAGDRGVMLAFTSSSTLRAVAFDFAGRSQDSAVLHFTGGGYDIRKYSLYEGEAELLIEPGREYHVGSVQTVHCNHGEADIVHLLTSGPATMQKPDEQWKIAKILPSCPGNDLPICPVCSCCPA